MTPLTYQILLALADRDRHGYGIIKEIEKEAGEGSTPTTGALYLALQRMEAAGLIEETRDRAGGGEDARRRYYGITREGRAAAERESVRLRALVASARRKNLIPGGADA